MSSSENLYELIIAGGGLSGVAVAIAAARENIKVLIIEKNGFLGGMATAGLVNPFMAYCLWTGPWKYDWNKKVNQGIFGEILANLEKLDGLKDYVVFNEEILKLVLDNMLKENGIDVLFHTSISKVKRKHNKIDSIYVSNKAGITCYKSHYFVDTTGDADLSAFAGCEYKLGRDKDNFCQPMTLCFRIAKVDKSKLDPDLINRKYLEAKEKGFITNPREDVLIFPTMIDDVLHFNSTRIVGKSAINPQDLTEAEIEGRRQAYELYRFLKNNIPAFKNSELLMSAPQIGIRESRRIVGEYTITEDDILSTKKFEDSIARGTYSIDIHNPAGTGTSIQDVPYGNYYTIPYRALIPKGIDNLIVAGRPISATHEAHSAYRIMPICTCIGEGAGIAASIAIKEDIPFKNVNYKEIQNLLDKYKALY
jgi:hypothetical protein